MHENEIKRRLRVINEGLRSQFRAGAVNEGVVERLYIGRYQLERTLSQQTGRRVLHLVCGHERTIDVATYEELDMERTGTVQCRAIKKVLGWPEHRWQHVGVLGWEPMFEADLDGKVTV